MKYKKNNEMKHKKHDIKYFKRVFMNGLKLLRKNKYSLAMMKNRKEKIEEEANLFIILYVYIEFLYSGSEFLRNINFICKTT